MTLLMFLLIHYYFLINDPLDSLIVPLKLLFNWCNHPNVIIVPLLLLFVGIPFHVHVIPLSYFLILTASPPCSSSAIDVIPLYPFVHIRWQQLLLWILLLSLTIIASPLDLLVHPHQLLLFHLILLFILNNCCCSSWSSCSFKTNIAPPILLFLLNNYCCSS
jgi:hypothetical protein